jgi:hypothetical protein
MSLQNLGAAPFVLGLAAIAGLLFLLQRLRVKFSEREVVTTLFWKQAVEETRARMLTRRFRHPLAYLLALAIAGLVWLAIAGPDRTRENDTDHVLLLDGSAGMAWGDRFERAKALLRQEAERLPAARRRIYFCGADARLILDRREEASLLLPRLANLTPEACPSSVERELLALATDEAGTGNIKLLVVGDAPVSEAALAMLPENATVERLRSEQTPRLGNNSGIASIGVAGAASGSLDRVDVMFELAGSSNEAVTIALGGTTLDQVPTWENDRCFLRDLPARGEVLEIALPADDPLPIDDRARITLPTRSTIAVAVDESLDPRFHALVDADPALVKGPGAPEVVIGGAADGSLPAIELVTGNGIAVIYESDLALHDLEQCQRRFADTGLDRVGWKLGPAADRSGGFGLSPRFVPGPRRKVQIGVELIGNDCDFMQTSAFPLFLSASIRWLAGVEQVEPFAVAGERSAHAGQFTLAGSDYAPPRAGPFANRNGDEIEVALPAVKPPERDALKQVARSTDRRPWPGVFTCCILLALLLVGGEWWAFQKGRIP